MKVSLNLLKKFVSLDQPIQEIADALTLLGLEVDSIDPIGQNLSDVIPVEIAKIEKHPTLDKVQILTVKGRRKQYTVICGDLGVKEGQISAFSPIGATITPHDSAPLKITKRAFGKIESQGMLCSEADLGISSDNSAILKLSKSDLELDSIAPLFQDTIFDISLTPNLGHCRSILGVARELSARMGTPLAPIDQSLHEDNHSTSESLIKLQNMYENGALQYKVRVMKNITVSQSPFWLKRAVQNLGYQSVNNVVDCLNYTMHMLGQPLHAFDLDTLEGKTLQVKSAKGSEVMSALNHKDYKVNEGAVLICDQKGPVCIAGIIGDEKSSVTDATQNIVIEAAQFCHQMVRKTTKSIGLRSDSSNRFENQIDPKGLEPALNFVCKLIQENCDGCICKGIASASYKEFTPRVLSLRLEKIHSIIGIKLSISEVETFLTRLDMPHKFKDGVFQVRIPSYRNDLRSEIDLVEEVLRLYGYNNITKLDLNCTLSNQPHHKLYIFKRQLAKTMQRLSFSEIVSCNLISEHQGELEGQDLGDNQKVIKVMHAKSQDQSVLRPTLLSGFLNAARINQRQGERNLRLYEVGHTYHKNNELIQEDLTLALLLAGQTQPFHYNTTSKENTFFTMKGMLESLFKSCRLQNYTFRESKSTLFHPHQQAQVFQGDELIALFGRLHPNTLEKYDCKGPIYFAEINTKRLLEATQAIDHFTALINTPSSQRDLTLHLSRTLSISKIEEQITKLECPILESYELISIFEPKENPDKHNVTFRFTYRDKNKTLLDSEILFAHNSITQKLENV